MPADPNCPPYVGVDSPSKNANKSKQAADNKVDNELSERANRLVERARWWYDNLALSTRRAYQ